MSLAVEDALDLYGGSVPGQGLDAGLEGGGGPVGAPGDVSALAVAARARRGQPADDAQQGQADRAPARLHRAIAAALARVARALTAARCSPVGVRRSTDSTMNHTPRLHRNSRDRLPHACMIYLV